MIEHCVQLCWRGFSTFDWDQSVKTQWRIQGKGPGGRYSPPRLIFRPNWGPKSRKIFFWGGAGPPPPSTPLSQGYFLPETMGGLLHVDLDMSWEAPWVPEVFSRVRRGVSLAAARPVLGRRPKRRVAEPREKDLTETGNHAASGIQGSWEGEWLNKVVGYPAWVIKVGHLQVSYRILKFKDFACQKWNFNTWHAKFCSFKI